jgi:putative ABC transport system permease protein
MHFISTKELGFDKDQMLVIPTQMGWAQASDDAVMAYRTRLEQEPEVLAVAGTSSSFSRGWSRYGYTIDEEQKAAFVYAVDPEYIPTLGLEIVEGRNFDAARASDSLGVIVNEALVRDMGWENPLEEYLNWREDSIGPGAPVIGVLKDYHFLSLEHEIGPMFLSMDKKNVGYLITMLVKVSSRNIPETVKMLESTWKELYPNKPFEYSFMDEDVARQYASHERWMKIMSLSTGLAILIACLGLFGLSGINSLNKTKEIGIRKIMGAELKNIFFLLNREYFIYALIAFSLAVPFSWYAMDQWLADFQFRITVGWEIFAVSILAGVVIAFITVSYHGIKASLVNPAETLKYE